LGGKTLDDGRLVMTPAQFCLRTIKDLQESSDFAGLFVQRKLEFCRSHQMGYVFSTRFGAGFFEEAYRYLMSNSFLEPEKGLPLGDYDKNFNAWLKTVRTIK
jgi:hypothetical protein